VRPDGTVKVLDFGLAKALLEEPKEAKTDLHVTMLLNWFEELKQRVPTK
jgi:pectate lyase